MSCFGGHSPKKIALCLGKLGRVKAQLKEQDATIAVGQPSSDIFIILSSNYNISKTSLSDYFVGPIYFGLSLLFLANFCLIK